MKHSFANRLPVIVFVVASAAMNGIVGTTTTTFQRSARVPAFSSFSKRTSSSSSRIRRPVTVGSLTRQHATVSSSSSSNAKDDDIISVFQNHLLSKTTSRTTTTTTTLNHRFFALRHGQSSANVAGIIASSPDIACHQYGLSEVGKEQAQAAGRDLVERFLQEQQQVPAASTTIGAAAAPPFGIAIVTSDLLRAKETAQIVADVVLANNINSSITIPLYSNDIVVDVRLRERGFGEWDGGSDIHYQDVWNDDSVDPYHTTKGVESVWSVTDRATRCVLEWDSKNTTLLKKQVVEDDRNLHWWIICVAHGDVLQILQTAFSKMDPSQHRSLDHLETATLRPLILAPWEEATEE